MIRGVSILIPTHNRAAILRQTLESLAQTNLPAGVDVELVVVGNACTDDSESVFRDVAKRIAFPSHYVVEDRANLNIARNAAVRNSTQEVVIILDDDVWVDAGWLQALVQAYSDSDIDIVAGRVSLWWKDVPRPEWFNPTLDSLLTQIEFGDKPLPLQRPGQVAGANFSFRRQVFDTIGPFIEGLDRTGANVGLSGGESEFIQRALNAGFTMSYFPGVAVKHWVAPGRIEMTYLLRVAFANGASRILIKPRIGLYGLLRCVFGNSGIYAINGVRAGWNSLLARRSDWASARVHMTTARGALYGLWVRLTGRSPVR